MANFVYIKDYLNSEESNEFLNNIEYPNRYDDENKIKIKGLSFVSHRDVLAFGYDHINILVLLKKH